MVKLCGGLAARDRASMPRDGFGARERASLKASVDRWERDGAGLLLAIDNVSL